MDIGFPLRVVYYNWQFGIKVGKVVYYLASSQSPSVGLGKVIELKNTYKEFGGGNKEEENNYQVFIMADFGGEL